MSKVIVTLKEAIETGKGPAKVLVFETFVKDLFVGKGVVEVYRLVDDGNAEGFVEADKAGFRSFIPTNNILGILTIDDEAPVPGNAFLVQSGNSSNEQGK